jgi:RND family efflux transporter MFP subunit
MSTLGVRRIASRIGLIGLLALAPLALLLGADEHKGDQVVLEVKGYLTPSHQISVSPRVAGHVVELRIEEGSQVKKGDVIARLDAREYDALRRLAEAELHIAQAGLARLAGDAVAKAEVAIAQAQVDRATAQLELAQLRLDGAVVRAPFDGTVLVKRVDVGSLVDPKATQVQSSICDLGDLQKMEVEIWVQERDLGLVSVGQRCSIRLETFPQETRRGRVVRILPVADRAKNSVAVRVQVEAGERGSLLRPDSSAVVQLLKQ